MPHTEGHPIEDALTAAQSSTQVAREREGQSQEIPSIDPGSVRRRSAFKAFQDDVRQATEGNPVFEALNFIAKHGGRFLGAEPGGASLPVGGFVKQGAKLKSALPPFEDLLKRIRIRAPKPMAGDFGKKGLRIAKEEGPTGLSMGIGRSPKEALETAAGEARHREEAVDAITSALESPVGFRSELIEGYGGANAARRARNLMESPAGAAITREGTRWAFGEEGARRLIEEVGGIAGVAGPIGRKLDRMAVENLIRQSRNVSP